jgi:hypothetical protein
MALCIRLMGLAGGRDLLRRIVKEHTLDGARQELTEGIVNHLEQSRFRVGRRQPSAQEAPARSEPRLARRFGRSVFASAASRGKEKAASGSPSYP